MNDKTKEKYRKEGLVQNSNSKLFETSKIFLFSRGTKLSDLKQEVCEFWDLDAAEFELFEGSHILLMRYDETVEMYFYSTIDAQRAAPELVLQVPDRTSYFEPTNDQEGEANKAEAAQSRKAKLDQENKVITEKQRKKKARQIKARQLEEKYPGLSKYSYGGKIYQEREFGIDNHISAFIVMAIMMAWSIIIFFERRNVMNQYFMGRSIQDTVQNPVPPYIPFNFVGTPEYFREFMNGTFLNFVLDPESELRRSCNVVGLIRIRQLRVKSKECSREEHGPTCYERDYNSRTKDTSDFTSPYMSVSYLTPEDANQKYTFDGNIGTYDGGGLVVDWPGNATHEEFYYALNRLIISGFISPATRAVVNEWTLYNPSLNLFAYCRMLFEFSPFGVVIPAHVYVRSFRFSLDSESANKRMEEVDYLRLFLSFYFLFINILILYKARQAGMLKNLAIVAQVLANLFIFIVCVLLFVYNRRLAKKSENEYASRTEFVVSHDDAYAYEQIYILEAILFFFITYKFLSVFRRYLPLQIIMTSIERAALIIVAYMVIIFPYIIAFAIMFRNLVGEFMSQYSTFLSSLLYFFLMCTGRVSANAIIYYNKVFGTLYLVLYYIFALHFVIVTFAAIYIGVFRSTIDAYGYPSDERKSKKWGVRDLIKWVVSWLPEKWLVRLNLQESLSSGVAKKKQEDPEEKKEAVAN